MVLMTHNKALVDALPRCDLFKAHIHTSGAIPDIAKYDARVEACGNVWANLCQYHFDFFHCSLGVGNGQELILKTKGGD